jgi:hypothetical protein
MPSLQGVKHRIMKAFITILIITSFIGVNAQDIPYLKQSEMDSCFWHTDFGFYDRLDPLTYLKFSSPQNGESISYQVAPNKPEEVDHSKHISWKEPARANWITQKDVVLLLPLIMSAQPCLPAVLMYSSNSCQELSTVGKEACQILLAGKENPYPNRCSVITNSEWDKMIYLVGKKFGE